MRRGLVWSLVGIIVLAAVALSATLAAGHTILLGLDLRGGVSVVLKPTNTVTSAELDEAVNIIDNRINGLGIGNSDVSKQGNNIVINLPGIKNSASALAVLGQTATLYFRPVLCIIPNNTTQTPATKVPNTSPTTKAALSGHPAKAELTSYLVPAASGPSTPTPTTTAPANTGTGAPLTEAEANAACSSSNAAELPTTSVQNDTSGAYVILPYYDHSVRYVLGPADMKGDVVSNTSVIAPTAGGGYQVQVTFTSSGANQFDNIAAKRYPYYQSNPSNPPYSSMEAIELDGVVQSAPTIQAAAFHGTAVISGSSAAPFSSKQAGDLALVLKYGSLPVRFVPQSVQTVSASIGKDSLRAGLLAGIVGIVIVMIYMLFYYRLLALVVLVGLGIGGALLYSILAQLSQSSRNPLTLTLAGITGIIVSIGITVDSYIVFFERLKDEVRAGRTVRQSVERSFSRAFRTVLTADLVSFLAALILWLFTVGDVRGFAFTLGLSTALDVFVAWFFIRPAVILIGRRRGFVDNPVFGINRGLRGKPVPREA